MTVEAVGRQREAEFRRFWWRAWGGAVVGNVVTATMVGILQAVSARVYLGIPPSQYVPAYITIHASLLPLVLVATWFIAGRLVRRRMRWFLEARQASRAELERFAALPRFVASANVFAWGTATASHLAYFDQVQQHPFVGWSLLKTVAIFAFGYIAGTAFAYLLMERAFRPYLRLILPTDVSDWPPSMTLAPRLLVAWFAVAGAPLLLIAFTLVGLTDRQSVLAASALRVTAVLAVVVGLMVFVAAGRTVTVPLRRLQQALRDVMTGDLTTHVEVDEAGEIGHVQAGFNNMVDGLAALASDNERLQAELRGQLDAVQASRIRIVEAVDAERARIERNLHDGAQQHLLSLSFALRGIERSAREGTTAEDDVRAALIELETAMSELRELARGIHPAILDEEGLGPALGSLAERAPVPTEVTARLPGRLPSAVEVTAYFVAAESVANIAKYADASRAMIEVMVEHETLRIQIADDGRGGADPQRGSGLRGLTDRVAALGGEFRIESAPGDGTRITALIPCG